MSKRSLIVTHPGKVGDFLATLPVASALHKSTGEKIHFILPRSCPFVTKIVELVLLQDMTAGLSLLDLPVEHFGCGGQPYKFDLEEFGIVEDEDSVLHFGYKRVPDAPIARFVGEEFGLRPDKDFVLKIWDDASQSHWKKGSSFVLDADVFNRASKAGTLQSGQIVRADMDKDFLHNLRLADSCEFVHTTGAAFLVAADLAHVRGLYVYKTPANANGLLPLFVRNYEELTIVD